MQGLEGRVLEKRPVDGFPAAPLRPQPGKSSCPHQRQVAAPKNRVATAKIRTLSHDGGVRIYLYMLHQNKDYRKVVLIFSFIEEGRGLEGAVVNNITKIKI